MMNFFKDNATIENYKKLMPFVKPYWHRAVIALGLAIPIGCLDAVIALSLKPCNDYFKKKVIITTAVKKGIN